MIGHYDLVAEIIGRCGELAPMFGLDSTYLSMDALRGKDKTTVAKYLFSSLLPVAFSCAPQTYRATVEESETFELSRGGRWAPWIPNTRNSAYEVVSNDLEILIYGGTAAGMDFERFLRLTRDYLFGLSLIPVRITQSVRVSGGFTITLDHQESFVTIWERYADDLEQNFIEAVAAETGSPQYTSFECLCGQGGSIAHPKYLYGISATCSIPGGRLTPIGRSGDVAAAGTLHLYASREGFPADWTPLSDDATFPAWMGRAKEFSKAGTQIIAADHAETLYTCGVNWCPHPLIYGGNYSMTGNMGFFGLLDISNTLNNL